MNKIDEVKRNVKDGYFVVRVPFPDEGIWVYLTKGKGENLELMKFYNRQDAEKVASEYENSEILFKSYDNN